ncbi:hypothetical protein EIP91_008776 [Steccherinum ochraceum]|uniref:Cytochrome P450 n=1 Tax=Steccherinum ochraceum TaxID=92696 RepID=A0A4R0RC98_9APHY|nr:hypothetical protein EIP91_008776 [Steccherinum ochraceum]
MHMIHSSKFELSLRFAFTVYLVSVADSGVEDSSGKEGNRCTGKRHEHIYGLHEQYNSNVVRIGPNELSFRDASLIGPMMGTHGLSKGPGFDGLTAYSEIRALSAWRDSEMHALRRRAWVRGMGANALNEYEALLVRRVGQVIEALLERKGAEVDIANFLKRFGFDFMNDMAFGGGPEYVQNGDVQGTLVQTEVALRAGMIPDTIPWVGHFVAGELRKEQLKAEVKAKARIERGSTSPDLFHYLNHEDSHEEERPSLSIVAVEGLLVTVAGAGTAVAAVCCALYFLLRYPEAYKKVQEEIDKFYPQGEDALNTRHFPDMVYLDAVVNETLRLYSAQMSGSQRATDEHGIMAGSHYIPPYTSVRVHTYSVHRDPRNFSPSPSTFWPERWLIAENPSDYKGSEPFIHNMNAYIPFSFGPANCVGKSLALKVVKMALCALLQRANVKFAKGYDPEEWDRKIGDFVVLEVGRLPVVIGER